MWCSLVGRAHVYMRSAVRVRSPLLFLTNKLHEMDEKKKSIISRIREMELEGTEIFPISKRIYILNLISYRLADNPEGMKWRIKSDKGNQTVTVTRAQ